MLHGANARLLDWELDEAEELIGPDLVEYEHDPMSYWYPKFRTGQYDWNDPTFAKENTGPYAYRVIPLSQHYFMIVSPHDYERMTRYPDGSPKKWWACIRRHPQTGDIISIYARRRGRGDEPLKIYAHRELIGCLEDNGVVDHKNGWGLDNRRGTPKHPVNLHYTSHGENGHNAIRSRSTNLILPRGVEPRRKNKQGEQLYGGMYCKRSGKKVRTVRSKRVWRSPERAGQWYWNQMRKLHRQRAEWAHNPESVNYPSFPPLLPDDVPF